jgi:hypothetical protein
MKSFFSKDALIGGIFGLSAVLLQKPTLEFLALPTDGWHRYAALIGWLLLFNGVWFVLKKLKQKGEP